MLPLHSQFFSSLSQNNFFMNFLFISLWSYEAMVRSEIQEETNRVTGKTNQISPLPINLSIYSENGMFSPFINVQSM